MIQARSNSERLPGKIYAGLPEPGSPALLEHIYRRLGTVRGADVLCVLIPDSDELLRDFCQARGIAFFVGPEQDVRSRYRMAAEHFGLSIVVRATADNPLTDPGVAEDTISMIRGSDFDLLSYSNLPLGMAVESFRRSALDADVPYLLPEHAEHVSLHIKHHPELFSVEHLSHPLAKDFSPGSLPRLTVDTASDLSVVRRVVRLLGPDARATEILQLWMTSPQTFSANRDVVQRSFARAPVRTPERSEMLEIARLS